MRGEIKSRSFSASDEGERVSVAPIELRQDVCVFVAVAVVLDPQFDAIRRLEELEGRSIFNRSVSARREGKRCATAIIVGGSGSRRRKVAFGPVSVHGRDLVVIGRVV
jgi:hypothetical protein